jgi:hypothetical protein
MLTEKEAAESWCPFSRVFDGRIEAAVNRDWHGPVDGNECVASRCMAWRWGDPLHERGYCGMAGKPVVP